MNTAHGTGTAATAARPALHWSFDQDHTQTQRGFGAELRATLREYYRRPAPAAAGYTAYRVLPNFWSGYQSRPVADLAIGRVEMVRTGAGGGSGTDYLVTSRNSTSGEHATYSFRTAADRWRSLAGQWRIEIRNDAGGAYRRYVATGTVWGSEGDGERPILLTVGDADLPAGAWSGSRPLTTPWALIDILPELQEGCELALLEELDRLREPVRVVAVESWRWPAPDADLGSFAGWCVHGPGLLPTYYWVDGNGTVAVVSGLFQTWVISAAAAEAT